MYYCSQGLKHAEELKRGAMVCEPEPDFENEYCKVNWYDGSLNSADELKQLIVTEKERMIYNDPAKRL